MVKKSYKRSARVGELLRQEISELLRREVKDPRAQGATITEVSVSDDLSHARVYYNTAMCSHPAAEIGEALTRTAGFLRGRLRERMDLRHPPALVFEYDETFDRGAKMDAVLAGLSPRKPQASPSEEEADE